MTALAELNKADRRRLEDRPAELGDLADLMRQPGGLAEAPEPVPLYSTGRGTTSERTTS